MNIAFLSSLNPTDIHCWSGTLFYMWKSLNQYHTLDWIGREILDSIKLFHYNNNLNNNTSFYPEKYAMVLGKKLSEYFLDASFDIIICRDYFFLAYLITDIPIIYIGDTTFRLFNSQYLKNTNDEFIKLADDLEKRSLNKATHIVFSSEWAKNSAIIDYDISPNKISVIEFGANIDFAPSFLLPPPSMDRCNLLFIGNNWKMKGGDIVIDILRDLERMNLPCSLTIVGSIPDEKIDYPNVMIYPYIDKAAVEGRKLFEKILKHTHFLIAPTLFDCFGIVFCEAAAFGIPVLTTSVGGVCQVVKDGINGFVFSLSSSVQEYSNKILDIFYDYDRYCLLRRQSREEYEIRLNWKRWGSCMNQVLHNILCNESINYIVPLYITGCKTESIFLNISQKYIAYPEFNIHRLNKKSNMNKIIRELQKNGDEVFIICTSEHNFNSSYSSSSLFRDIQRAFQQNADLLLGYISDAERIIPISNNRFWVYNPIRPDFLIIYKTLFDSLLSIDNLSEQNIISESIKSAENIMVNYPFYSMHREDTCNIAEEKIKYICKIYQLHNLKLL